MKSLRDILEYIGIVDKVKCDTYHFSLFDISMVYTTDKVISYPDSMILKLLQFKRKDKTNLIAVFKKNSL